MKRGRAKIFSTENVAGGLGAVAVLGVFLAFGVERGADILGKVVMAVGAVVFAPIIGLWLWLRPWSRRGGNRPDPAGSPSFAHFRGGSEYLTPAELEPGPAGEGGDGPLGEGLLERIGTAIRSLGGTVDPPNSSEYAWNVFVAVDRRKAYLSLGRIGGEPEEWGLAVDDASNGGPPPPAVLGLVRAALDTIPGLSDIRWTAREIR